MKISLVKPVSGYNLAAINDNFVKLEQELQDKVLYRDNPEGEPNAVITDLDMNGKRILNLSELQVGGVNISGLNSAVVWRGTWSGVTAYARNDAVYHSGSSYICVTPNTNSAPPSANWNLFAAQGATGAGTGDVLGPASATLDTVATYASGTGKLLKASGVAISSLALAGPLVSSGITGAAASGANSDIISLTGLTSPVAEVRQIQPISASVSGNALTISASALALEFRSVTLTSGAVSLVKGTPANLVISSGSTLGTINATQSRIVVLALNNAGTIELAAVNISGGNDLSETGLISTTAEGGAGAADSASVIYSTTARTSVAYRVIGYVESTQATAGTWTTTPSAIQGAGGNAMTVMASMGYGQTWQNVTGSRALSTTYYNTTWKPISVYVKLNAVNDATPTVNGTALPSGYVWTSFVVPVGQSYSVASPAGIAGWSELR